MKNDLNGLNLNNIAGGAAAEIFQRELESVMENINDPNTKADTAREIQLTITIKPDPYRETIAVMLSAKTKLSPVKGAAGIAYLGKQKNGRLQAFAHNVNQLEMNTDQPLSTVGEKEEVSNGQ